MQARLTGDRQPWLFIDSKKNGAELVQLNFKMML
jgi:hypothetical protein